MSSPLRDFPGSTRLFLAATLLDGVMHSAWSLFFNFYVLSLGYNKSFLGLVTAAPWLAALLFSLLMGVLVDRIGPRKAMLIGLAVNVGGMAAQALVNQPAALVMTAFVGGMGYALWSTSGMPFMMSVSNSENRAMLFSLNAGLLTLAGAAGSLFAGQMPARFAAWLQVAADSPAAYRAVLLSSVALALVSLLPVLLMKEPARMAPAGRREKRMARLFSRPLVWKLMLPNVLIGIGAGLLIPYLNLFFVEKFQLNDQVLGALFSVSSLVTGLSIGIGPRLARRLRSKVRATYYSQAASLLFLLGMGFTPLAWLAGLCSVLRVAFMNMANPLYSAFSMEQVDPAEQGAASGLFNSTYTLGWFVGPVVSGLIQQRYGFSPLFVITGVLYAAAILLVRFFFGRVEWASGPGTQVSAGEPALRREGGRGDG